MLTPASNSASASIGLSPCGCSKIEFFMRRHHPQPPSRLQPYRPAQSEATKITTLSIYGPEDFGPED
jgi:hypothetical protein